MKRIKDKIWEKMMEEVRLVPINDVAAKTGDVLSTSYRIYIGMFLVCSHASHGAALHCRTKLMNELKRTVE